MAVPENDLRIMDYHSKIPFPVEGGGGGPKSDTGFVRCSKFPSADILNLNFHLSNFLHASHGIPRIPDKDIKGVQYSAIMRK